MTARQCFTNKVRAGKVGARAGKALLDLIERFEQEKGVGVNDDPVALRKAAIQAAIETTHKASRQADLIAGSIVAQANVLRVTKAYAGKVEALRGARGDFGFGNKAPPTLGKTTQTPLGFALRSLLARDPWEIANWSNVHALAQQVRAGAHAIFADAIEMLRPKKLGFADEHAKELDVLRGLYGGTDVHPDAIAAARSFTETAESLRRQYVEAGGALPERKTWRLPNPDMDPAKVRAMGRDGFKDFVRARVDRADMIDFVTKRPLDDARFERLLNDAFDTVSSNGATGLPEANATGQKMLANSRDVGRFFSWKDADAWMAIADTFGTHQSPFHTMVGHINGMADDIAAMRILGPNPAGTLRFMQGLFDREGKRLAVEAENKSGAELAAATRQNNAIENRVRVEKRLTEDLFAEVTGANRAPVSTTMARGFADVRHLLSAAQLGSALISSFTDLATVAMTARMNALPFTHIIGRALELAKAPAAAEVHLAQMGMTADAIAHAMGAADRLMGETIRTGTAAKLSGAVIRASGLRLWTALLRGSFGLEMQAKLAREHTKAFGELEPELKEALGRYGVTETDWAHVQAAVPHEPRPGAPFLRPQDIANRDVAEKIARLVHTEMDYAVIERDPVMRALMVGDTRPGTASGELRRSVSMYRSFSGSIITYHVARAVARGWDGARLGHGALTFLGMTALGALSMQAKELNQGRDALSMDPRNAKGLQAWGKAIMQGGGLGVFGDVVFADKTRMDSSWASVLGGPILSGTEDVLGKFLIRNLQLAAKGKPTHFAGDALYVAGRYLPGSSLWQTKLAFNRAVLDQAAQIIDPRARERFHRLESEAQKTFGQQYWFHPGQAAPSRAPAILGSP